MHAFQQAQTQKTAPRLEQGAFQRVPINMQGRLMLANYEEFECLVIDMSPGDMYVTCPGRPRVNERVVAYIDHLGRLEGVITRHFENGFAMTIAATSRKRDKIAAQLTWLANRHLLDSPEDRRHGRFVPKNPMTMLILPNGINLGCRLIDLSLSGAAVSTDQRPAMGTLVTLGKVQGRVVRHLDDGFAVEFLRMQHPDFVEESVTGA